MKLIVLGSTHNRLKLEAELLQDQLKELRKELELLKHKHYRRLDELVELKLNDNNNNNNNNN